MAKAASEQPDFTSREGVSNVMKGSTSLRQWCDNAGLIRAANHGKLPDFWNDITPDIYNRIKRNFGKK